MNRKTVTYNIVDKGCWICTSHSCDTKGYPKTIINKKPYLLHRILYQETYPERVLTKIIILRHTCDNKLCINPEHQLEGSHKDNVNDRVKRDRSAKGEKHGRAKLKAYQVIAIYQDKTTPVTILSKTYGVNRKAIRLIQNGTNWRHLTGASDATRQTYQTEYLISEGSNPS